MNNTEATGKIAKWAIELSIYDIVYKPRSAIKAQVLSDFVAKWIEIQTPSKGKRAGVLNYQLRRVHTTSRGRSRNSDNISQRENF
jgi:hypothetical protein